MMKISGSGLFMSMSLEVADGQELFGGYAADAFDASKTKSRPKGRNGGECFVG